MYDNKQMLGQFGDFSGHWTPEQLAITGKACPNDATRGRSDWRILPVGPFRESLAIFLNISTLLVIY